VQGRAGIAELLAYARCCLVAYCSKDFKRAFALEGGPQVVLYRQG
jgi:hypothetical protein